MAYRYDPYGLPPNPMSYPATDPYSVSNMTPHTGPMRGPSSSSSSSAPRGAHRASITNSPPRVPVDHGWASLDRRMPREDPSMRGGARGRGRRGGRGGRGGGRGRDRDDYDYGDDGYDDDDGGPGGRGPVRRPDFDQIVDDRISRERPCRTLFIRNIKYGTKVEVVREIFEPIGHIKTLFDRLEDRGMIFLTFYDLRAAMMAKDQLHEKRVSGRPMDVHYGLLRDSDLKRTCDPEKNQGTLSLVVPDARGPLDDREIQARFGAIGEIKHIVPGLSGRPNEWMIEFFDSRAMERAHDEMQGQPMAGGTIDLKFDWDLSTIHPGPTDAMPRHEAPRRGAGRDRRRSRELSPVRYPAASVDPYHRNAPPPPPSYGRPDPYAAAPPAVNDQLEQARKMQALLASMTGGAPPPPAAQAPASATPPTGYYQPPPPQNPYAQPPPQSNPYGSPPPPPANPYGQPPQSNPYGSPGPAPAAQSQPYQSYPHQPPPPANNPYASSPPPSNNQGGPSLPPALAALLKTTGGQPPSQAQALSQTNSHLPPHVGAQGQNQGRSNTGGGASNGQDLSGLLALLAQQHGQKPYHP